MAHTHEAADLLRAAAAKREPCAPVRHLAGLTVDDAYVIQELVMSGLATERNPRIGRKIGLTSPLVQHQLGVDRPDFGVLLADMRIDDGGTIPFGRLLQPRIEAEVAFVLAEDLIDAHPDAVARAIAFVAPALEIVDSRIAGWDISIVDTIADNASSGMFVLGSPATPLADVDPATVVMTLRRNGDIVSQGTGADCLGSPLNALVWVAETALALGRPLRAGEVVLSGALGPMVPVAPGDLFEAELTTLGTVSVVAESTTASTRRPTTPQH